MVLTLLLKSDVKYPIQNPSSLKKKIIDVILDTMDNIRTQTTEHGLYNYTYDDLYRLRRSDKSGRAGRCLEYKQIRSTGDRDFSAGDVGVGV